MKIKIVHKHYEVFLNEYVGYDDDYTQEPNIKEYADQYEENDHREADELENEIPEITERVSILTVLSLRMNKANCLRVIHLKDGLYSNE